MAWIESAAILFRRRNLNDKIVRKPVPAPRVDEFTKAATVLNLQESPSRSTSPSLLVRVQTKDPEAWQRLLTIYGPLVFHWCERTSLTSADSADVLQDVFIAVSKSIGAFQKTRPGDSFRGWLWTITRNKVRDFCRRKSGQVDAVGGTNAWIQLASVAENLSDDSLSVTDPREVGGVFRRATELVKSEFEARTWDAFWRSAVEEEPTAEIAASLGITANAVRQAKSRVLRRLRQELGDLAD